MIGGQEEKHKKNRLFDIDKILQNIQLKFNYLDLDRVIWSGNFNFIVDQPKQTIL